MRLPTSVPHTAVTFNNEVGFDDDDPIEEPFQAYTQDEINAALANKYLTVDQALYLHTQGINWQIKVN
jgi:hypothetical protein